MQVYRANYGFLKQNPLDSSFAMEHAIAFAENPIAGVPYKWRTCCALTDVCDEPCRTCWDDAQSMLVVVMLCHMCKVVVVVRMREEVGDGPVMEWVGGERAGMASANHICQGTCPLRLPSPFTVAAAAWSPVRLAPRPFLFARFLSIPTCQIFSASPRRRPHRPARLIRGARQAPQPSRHPAAPTTISATHGRHDRR